MKLRSRHITVAALLLLQLTHAAAAQTTAHTFHVFLRGVKAGTEEVTVLDSPEGWMLRGSGRLGAPINLTTEYWEARYDRSWKPIELTLNLVDIETGIIEWSDEKEIRKQAERPLFGS